MHIIYFVNCNYEKVRIQSCRYLFLVILRPKFNIYVIFFFQSLFTHILRYFIKYILSSTKKIDVKKILS